MSAKLRTLNEQVIVITGASSGIGLATAKAASAKGAYVVLAARSGQTLDKITNELNQNGGKAIAVVADVADAKQVEAIANAALHEFGRIDTWVNNAGVSVYGKLEEVAEQDGKRLFDINFWGVVNGSLIALRHLKAHGGALINVGSEVSDAVIPLQGMYSASKHAVKGFTDALRVEVEEVEKAPVSITLIQPTAVDTPFPQHAKNYLDNEPKLPSPMIKPEQVAEAILHAAQKRTRDVKVGLMSKMNTFMAKNAPHLADKMSAQQSKRQQHDMPASRNREGALYKASEDGHVHGHAFQM
jgi:short-subunit dehydrogenase